MRARLEERVPLIEQGVLLGTRGQHQVSSEERGQVQVGPGGSKSDQF